MLLMPVLKKRLERESTVGNLPALQKILSDLQRFSFDPKTSTSQISEQVSHDPSLSVRLLRMANSAYYGRAEPVVSLEEAVLFLGIEQIRTVSMTMNCVENLSPQDRYGFDWSEFWRHCIATAYCSRLLGRFLYRKHADPELDYIAGLLHDVGKLVIAMLLPDGFGYVVGRAKEEKLSFCDAEKAYFDTDHAALGGWYLERQSMPAVVFEAVRCHHNWTLSVENQEIAAIVNVADTYAHENRVGASGNMQERIGPFTETSAWHFLTAQMNLKSSPDVIAQRLRDEAQRMSSLVDTLLPSGGGAGAASTPAESSPATEPSGPRPPLPRSPVALPE